MSDAQFRHPDEPGAPERHGGLGSVLVAVYIVLAIAATCRSVYQIITRFDEAPVAYALSAAAGLVYIVAAVALVKRWRAVAWAALGFELLGVLTVGTLSVTHTDAFGHDDTVWSMYGAGYLWIPLVLPVLGMLWLRGLGREEETLQTAPNPNESLY